MFIFIIEINHLTSYQLCMTWLNGSLKLYSSLWTIPHLILTHNTQNFAQVMLISFVWLYMFKCDVYAKILANWTQKIFKCFICFLKWFYTFMFLIFVQNAFLCFSSKNWFRGSFVRSSRLRASCEMCLREIKNSHFHIETLATTSQVLRD